MASLACISSSLLAAASLSTLIYVRVRLLLELVLSMLAETPFETMMKKMMLDI